MKEAFKRYFEKLNKLYQYSLSNNVYRVDIDKPINYDLKPSTKDTLGSNALYVDAAAILPSFFVSRIK